MLQEFPWKKLYLMNVFDPVEYVKKKKKTIEMERKT